MKTVTELDRNFILPPPEYPDAVFTDILSEPYTLYGVIPPTENEGFHRMPCDVAERVSENVGNLNYHTSGGRVRFKTDSPYICLSVKIKSDGRMPHFAFCGSYGFEMYEREETRYVLRGSFLPPIEKAESYGASVALPNERKMRDITIDFPLYSALYSVAIGLKKGSRLDRSPAYTVKKPVVFYGSSITQGACASRPGMMYPAVLSCILDFDYIDLGFSGSARAETTMAQYIADLDMSAFVYDYDHNAPDVGYLRATHHPFFERIREKNPSLPIVFLSRPQYEQSRDSDEREAVIRETYEKAVSDGDKNVYFVSGRNLMDLAGNDGSVDGVHPTDLGFYSMVRAVYPTLSSILYKR